MVEEVRGALFSVEQLLVVFVYRGGVSVGSKLEVRTRACLERGGV